MSPATRPRVPTYDNDNDVEDLSEEEDEEEEDDDEDVELDDDELELEAAALMLADPAAVSKEQPREYHVEQLQQSLVELRGGTLVPWIETLEVVGEQSTSIVNVDDDFQRELAFYKQALEGAVTGRELVLSAGVKFDRPTDYFAEMLKTDAHMQKVRQHLVDETQQIKRSEDAAKQRAMRKYGKQVQAEKLQERAKQKSQQLDKIKMVRKGRSNVEAALKETEFDISVNNNTDDSRNSKHQAGQSKKPTKKSFKDAKYGFGGRKRNSKSNTADSTSDLSTFSVHKNKAAFGAGKKSSGKKRPGKTVRQRSANQKR